MQSATSDGSMFRDDPFHSGSKGLRDFPGVRAVRVGGWRIIYEADTARQHLAISDIGPRGQIYRNL